MTNIDENVGAGDNQSEIGFIRVENGLDVQTRMEEFGAKLSAWARGDLKPDPVQIFVERSANNDDSEDWIESNMTGTRQQSMYRHRMSRHGRSRN